MNTCSRKCVCVLCYILFRFCLSFVFTNNIVLILSAPLVTAASHHVHRDFIFSLIIFYEIMIMLFMLPIMLEFWHDLSIPQLHSIGKVAV
jgi:hypothetical protein